MTEYNSPAILIKHTHFKGDPAIIERKRHKYQKKGDTGSLLVRLKVTKSIEILYNTVCSLQYNFVAWIRYLKSTYLCLLHHDIFGNEGVTIRYFREK